MTKGLLALISAALWWGSGTLQAALPPWKADSAATWFQEHPHPGDWPAAFESLKQSLAEVHALKGPQAFTQDESFSHWFDHLRWVGAGFGTGKIQNDPQFLRAFVEVGSKPAIAHEWIHSLTPYDKIPASLEILLRIHQAHPADLEEFPTLGVAYAVVFDQPFPKFWPHRQVDPDDIPRGSTDPVERFADLVRTQRDDPLDLDPRKLAVHELRFVVDTGVSFDELAWARKHVRLSRSKFGEAFSMVRYDMPRLLTGMFNWQSGNYTLEAIQKSGGICVDQAYFAATAGKAHGLPTLFFHGQGQGGGHAWFGYMERPGKWNTDCGRWQNQNYPVGEAINPQTWQPINDSELDWLVADLPKNPAYLPAQAALGWARMHRSEKTAEVLKWVREARGILPDWPDPWTDEAALLKDAPAAEQKEFFNQWIAHFNKQSDLKVAGQQQLLEILKKENDPAATELQKDIVRENRKKRFDIGIGAGAGAVFEKIDAGDWEAAEGEYKSLIRKFDDQGGGNLFYQVVQPYVVSCIEDAQWKRAESALDYAEKKMKIEGQSILGRELAGLRLRIKNKEQPPSPNPGGL